MATTHVEIDPSEAGRWLTPAPDSKLFPEPALALETRESVALAFLALLQQLPARQRAVFLLKDVLGWSVAETATTLEMSESAVSSALNRARESISAFKAASPTAYESLGRAASERATSERATSERATSERATSERATSERATSERATPERATCGRELVRLASTVCASSEPAPEVLQAYLRSWECRDVDTLLTLIRDDIVFAMPPSSVWFRGRAELERFLRGGQFTKRWSASFRTRLTRANGMIAVAFYRGEDRSVSGSNRDHDGSTAGNSDGANTGRQHASNRGRCASDGYPECASDGRPAAANDSANHRRSEAAYDVMNQRLAEGARRSRQYRLSSLQVLRFVENRVAEIVSFIGAGYLRGFELSEWVAG